MAHTKTNRAPLPTLQQVTDLEVAVHDAHVVQVLDGIQDLTDEHAGVFLRVEAFLDDTVEEFPAGYTGPRHGFTRFQLQR